MIAALAMAAVVSVPLPSGTFTCRRLMADKFSAATKDDFIPSVLGTFAFDGKGGYSQVQGAGRIVREKSFLRFADGPAKGMAGAQRTDARGRVYLLIDKSITGAPGPEPQRLDAVCYKA